MEDIKKIIGKNISTLRKYRKMTQIELAEALNYSDKAVSKWENGDSMPDVETLLTVAKFFGVTLDYLVTADHDITKEKLLKKPKKYSHNKIIITLLSVLVVWMFAVIAYIYMTSMLNDSNAWTIFIYSIPLSFIVLLVFNCLWGQRTMRFVFISLLTWSILLSIYIYFLEYNFWMIFLVGAPVQVAIALWSQIKKRN